MRFRDFGASQTTANVRSCWITSTHQSSDVDRNVPYIHTKRSSAMYDVVTPGFQRLKNQGVIINNPMIREEVSSQISPCWWVRDCMKNGIGIHQEYYNLVALSVAGTATTLPDITAFETQMSEFNSEMNLAITRSWANVDVSDAMLLASLGELPETLGWVKSIYTRSNHLSSRLGKKIKRYNIGIGLLRQIAEGLPKSRRKYESWLKNSSNVKSKRQDADVLKHVLDAWMEYRYAIRPLIFEMKSCIEAMQNVIKKGTRQTARGKEIRIASTETTQTYTRSWESQIETCTVRTTEESSVTARAGVLYEITNDLNALLSVWGIDQPLESAWELVPFSFIIDWFFSIGDVISSWSQSAGLSPLSSWVTLHHKSFVTRKCIEYSLADAGGYVTSSLELYKGQSYGSISRKWRKPSPIRPILPSFDLKLNLAKILDLGAISRSFLTGNQPPKYVKR